MTADLLREAAALMREQADVATPGPWAYVGERHNAGIRSDAPGCGGPWPVVDRELMPNDGEHIASWHPGVALAVADWLDAEAGAVEFDGGRPDLLSAGALAVARTYLGDLS